MTNIPNDVKRLMADSPCDGPYTVKFVGQILDCPVYLQVPEHFQGCVGMPTYVLVEKGKARYANYEETSYCMNHFDSE